MSNKIWLLSAIFLNCLGNRFLEILSRYKDSLPFYYDSFSLVLEHFEKNKGKFVLEIGPSLKDVDPLDWSHGGFTYLFSECLYDMNPYIYTVNPDNTSMKQCKKMTKKFGYILDYHVWPYVDFLNYFPTHQPIDLLYINYLETDNTQEAAQLQLEEARAIVKRNLINKNGLVVIDCAYNHEDQAKHSVPYFLSHGFRMLHKGFQIILVR